MTTHNGPDRSRDRAPVLPCGATAKKPPVAVRSSQVVTQVSSYIRHGDALSILPTLDAGSVDAVVTDPPYALGFMGKAWDTHTPVGFQAWCQAWAVECLRVLKPGGHLVAFGGTRTWHRLACAVEDAGFEVRDSIAWLYGSGFPKSLDVSKAIDRAVGAERAPGELRMRLGDSKPYPYNAVDYDGSIIGERSPRLLTQPATDDARTWQGWGTALKPAHEPIVVARKPLVGTVAQTVLAHGTGALNVGACRVGTSKHPVANVSFGGWREMEGRADRQSPGQTYDPNEGRWPPNVLLDGDAADALDEQSGTLTSGDRSGKRNRPKLGSVYDGGNSMADEPPSLGDSGGASRFFPTFRYQAKAPTRERPKVNGTAHPTVKPLELIRWLVRLVTPPGGTVLDPFAGSGTTGEACILEGFDYLLIEREADYLPLIAQRLGKHADTLLTVTA